MDNMISHMRILIASRREDKGREFIMGVCGFV